LVICAKPVSKPVSQFQPKPAFFGANKHEGSFVLGGKTIHYKNFAYVPKYCTSNYSRWLMTTQIKIKHDIWDT